MGASRHDLAAFQSSLDPFWQKLNDLGLLRQRLLTLMRPAFRQAIIAASETGMDEANLTWNEMELKGAVEDALARLATIGDSDTEQVSVPIVDDERGVYFVHKPGWEVTNSDPAEAATVEWRLYLLQNGRLYIDGVQKSEDGASLVNLYVTALQLAMLHEEDVFAIINGLDSLGLPDSVTSETMANRPADFDK